jgi:hypothetical protein
MWRFYLLASAIVLVSGSAIVAGPRLSTAIRVSATPSGSPTPTAERHGSPEGRQGGGERFSVSASWIMSALPACFLESERNAGPLDALRAKIPPPGARLAPGTRFTSGECAVEVRSADVVVVRGADRMQAPHASLYRVGDRLVLVSVTRRLAEIRIYDRRR